MQNIGKAIVIMFAGAFGGYIVKSVITSFITGTSIGENMNTYLVPIAVFVAFIVVALFTIFKRKNRNVRY